MTFHVELLVVLSMAIASAVLCVVANLGALRAWFAREVTRVLDAYSSREHVAAMVGVSTSLMFVGPAVGVLYGSDGNHTVDRLSAAAMFLIFGWAVVALVRRLSVLARDEAAAQARAVRNAVHEALAAERASKRVRLPWRRRKINR